MHQPDEDLPDPISQELWVAIDRPRQQWPIAVEAVCARHRAWEKQVRTRFASLVADAERLGQGDTLHLSARPRVLDDLARDARARPRISTGDVAPEIPNSADLAVPGKYRLLSQLDAGGIGVVYAGRDEDLGRDVALKFLQPEYANDPQSVRRFVAEAQLAGQLQHPGIVPVYDIGVAGEQPFFAMKLVEGEAFRALLARRQAPLDDLPRHLAIFAQVCQAVAYAHARGVIHRDLKPGNVMIGAFGEVQVLDWGMGKVLPPASSAETIAHEPQPEQRRVETFRSREYDRSLGSVGTVSGTPAYMSPEQAAGDNHRLDARTDVFALGSILCEILTGRPAYHSDNPDTEQRQNEVYEMARAARLDDARGRLSRSGAEPALVELANVCLSPDPAERPRDASAVAAQVTEYLAAVEQRAQEAKVAAETQRVRAEGEMVRARVATRQRRVAVSLAAVMAVAVAVAIWQWRIAAGAAASLRVQTRLAQQNEQKANDKTTEAESEKQRANREAAENTAMAARIAASDGRWVEAVAGFERASALGHVDPVALDIGRYEALEALGRMAEAVEVLDQLASRAQHGPHAAKVALLRGSGMVDVDRDQALALIRQAQELDAIGSSRLAPSDRAFAEAMLATDLDAIHDHLRAALTHDRRHLPSLSLLGLILLFRGEAEVALRFADEYQLLLPEAPEPVWLRILSLAVLARFDAAREQLRALEQSKRAETAPILSVSVEACESIEQVLGDKLRSVAGTLVARLPQSSRVVPPPQPNQSPAAAATDDLLSLLKTIGPRLLKILIAIQRLDVASDADDGVRLRLHPWVLEHYGKTKFLGTMRSIVQEKPASEGEGLPEAMIVLASDAMRHRVGPRPLRGMTAALPAVRRWDAMLAIVTAADPTQRAKAIAAALALPLSEEELLTYALIAVNLDLPNCWILADRFLLRWADLHGQTPRWRLLRAEVQLARGARAEALELVKQTPAVPPDDAWVRSLEARLSK